MLALLEDSCGIRQGSLGKQNQEEIIHVCLQQCQLPSCVQLSAAPQTVARRLLCPWDSLGKSIAVGSRFLLQGVFLTQGSTRGLLHCSQILYHLRHQESPHIYSLCVCVFYKEFVAGVGTPSMAQKWALV